MENSAHIQRPLTSLDIFAFATGYGSSQAAGPVQVAWLLENAALDRGWPIGDSLGSETDFINRFGSSRDVIRGAIRLVEARGLMRMRRGCKGGLRLLRPDLDYVAGAFATYLQASGYSRAKLEVVMSILAPLLDHIGSGAPVRQLWDRIAIHLSETSPAGATEGARAEIVAIQLVRSVGNPIPEAGVPLGCEAELCAEHVIGHRTFRQAMCILDDLGMLQVKRGRGGGYWLTRPTPIGITRRLFALLASRGAQYEDVEQVVWALGVARLRLVFRRMAVLDANQRAECCDQLATRLHGLTDLRRWVTFQQELTRIADDLLLSTTTSSMLAYLGRVGLPPVDNSQFVRRLLNVEQAMLQAMRDGLAAEAERHLRVGQSYLSHGA